MTPLERRLRWLDDRTMQLYRLDNAIKTGRIEGELRQMKLQNGERATYERTPEHRLQRHYEREYNRLVRKGATP